MKIMNSIIIFKLIYISCSGCDLSQLDATLLLLGAKANVNAIDKEGQTPLHKVRVRLRPPVRLFLMTVAVVSFL